MKLGIVDGFRLGTSVGQAVGSGVELFVILPNV
jgi:hypothetical protein